MWCEGLLFCMSVSGEAHRLEMGSSAQSGRDKSAQSLALAGDGGEKVHLLGRGWSWGRIHGGGAVSLRWARKGGREGAVEVRLGCIR